MPNPLSKLVNPRYPATALAFEKGWTPATLIWDVPTEFPDGANPPKDLQIAIKHHQYLATKCATM